MSDAKQCQLACFVPSRKWGLGIITDGRLYSTIATVERYPDGSWVWRAWNTKPVWPYPKNVSGSEPSRELAMQQAEKWHNKNTSSGV